MGANRLTPNGVGKLDPNAVDRPMVNVGTGQAALDIAQTSPFITVEG